MLTNEAILVRKGQLIQDALLGLTRRYPAKHVFVYGFMDYLSTLFQSDVVIVLWRKSINGGFEPWFTNCHEPLRRSSLSGYPFCVADLDEALIEGGINLHAPHSCRMIYCPDAKGIALSVVNIQAVQTQDTECTRLVELLDQTEKLLSSALAGSEANPIWTQIRNCSVPRIHPTVPETSSSHFSKIAKSLLKIDRLDTSLLLPAPPDAQGAFLLAITNFVDRYLRPKQGFLPLIHPCIRSAEVDKLRKNFFPYTIRHLVTEGLKRFVTQKLATQADKKNLRIHWTTLEAKIKTDASGVAIASKLKKLVQDVANKEPGAADKFFAILSQPLGHDSLSLALQGREWVKAGLRSNLPRWKRIAMR